MARRRLAGNHSKKQGLAPGTAVYVGAQREAPVAITVVNYDAEHVVEKSIDRVEDCFAFRDAPGVSWINVDGVHDAAVIQALAEGFGLHPLVQEDILNTHQRAKLEDFGDYLFLVARMIQWDDGNGEMDFEQVSLVLGENFVLSFQERPGDVFGPVRDRIRTAKARIRVLGASYLAYSLLDAIVDGYFVALEKRAEQIEAIEDELVSRPDRNLLQKIYHLRRGGLLLRKAVWPVRELAGALERAESPLIGEHLDAYLRDLYGHTVQAIDIAETLRDMLSGMLDTYLSSMSNRLNEVMKVLTIIATIFIPLTFIAGVYGMNFENMPEIGWRWGYATVWAVMLAVAAGMVVYIKRKRWM